MFLLARSALGEEKLCDSELLSVLRLNRSEPLLRATHLERGAAKAAPKPKDATQDSSKRAGSDHRTQEHAARPMTQHSPLPIGSTTGN